MTTGDPRRGLRAYFSRVIDPRIRRSFRRYLIQVSIATGSLMAVLLAAEIVTGGAGPARAVLIAAIASTAFVLFISPHSDPAQTRHVVGGHLLALLFGGALAGLAGSAIGDQWVTAAPALFAVYTALAVGFTMFAMAATNTEHPPAAGTALGVAAHAFSWELVGFVAVSVLVMVVMHRVLRSKLVNPPSAGHRTVGPGSCSVP